MSNKNSNNTPKPRNKTLNLKEIQRQDKRLSKMSTYVLSYDPETNTNSVIKYYEKFSQEKIDELLEEAYDAILLAEQDDDITFLKGENSETDLLGYISFLIAVRFTNLDKDVPKGFNSNYPIMLQMYDTGLTDTIHNEVLDSSETYRIFDKINQFVELANKIAHVDEETKREIISTVKNKEILGYGEVIHPLNNPSGIH